MILDFDGLLVDSAPECWLRCVDATQLDISLKSLKYSDSNKKIFLRMRYLVGPAYEFYFLIKSLEGYASDKEVRKKFTSLSEHNYKNAKRFEEYFFNSRVLAQKTDMQSWLESNNFFLPAIDMAKRFSKIGRLYIATMKDEESVLELLKYHNIECDKSKVLGRKYGDNKNSHLSYVIDQYPLMTQGDFLFMDDNIRHINEVCSLGIESALVTWGYGSESSISDAKKNKIQILNIEDCIKVVTGE